MAFVVIMESPGLTQEQYETNRRHVLEAQPPPPGLRMRISGPMEGGWRLIDVWESQADANAFGNSEAIQQIIRTGMAQGEQQSTFTTWEVNDVTIHP